MLDLVNAMSSPSVVNHVEGRLQQQYLVKDLSAVDKILGCKVTVDRPLRLYFD